jgi:hypothetical protein
MGCGEMLGDRHLSSITSKHDLSIEKHENKVGGDQSKV